MSETVTQKLMFFFPRCECEKPIIYHLVKDHNLIVNVYRAKVTPEGEGYLILDVIGGFRGGRGAWEWFSNSTLCTVGFSR